MSWLISDSTNANSTGHLSTYDGNLYYNQDSWRLCKNMMWIGPASQKWQQSIDLDGYFSTDRDFGFDKKFNGFILKTSDSMPSLSQAQGSLPTNTESFKDITNKTLSETVESYVKLYHRTKTINQVVPYAKSEIKNKGYYDITAMQDCTISWTMGDEDTGDFWFYAYVNRNIVISEDADHNKTLSFSVSKGDTIRFKIVHYSSHSSYQSYDSYESSLSDFGDNECHIVETYTTDTYYQCAKINQSWTSWLYENKNTSNFYIFAPATVCGNENGITDYLTYKLNYTPTYDILVAAYVEGRLLEHKVISAGTTMSDYEKLTFSLYNPYHSSEGSVVILYVRPYEGLSPQRVLKDELLSYMKESVNKHYLSSDFLTVGSLNGGGHSISSNLKENISALDSEITLSCSTSVSATRLSLVDNSKQSLTLPKINGLPIKDGTLRSSNSTSSYDLISPNESHYKSGKFVVTKSGNVHFRCHLRREKYFTGIKDYNYTYATQSFSISKNGNTVYSASGSTLDYEADIEVEKGDLIKVEFTGTILGTSYYKLLYDYDVVDKCYVDYESTTDKETGFTAYKSSYDSVNTPAYDMAFIVSKAGTLNWSYNDVRSGTTSSSDDGIFNIFVNGERQVRADNDNASSSGSLSLSVGDVVLIRYCTYSCTVGDKDSYVYVERGWDTPGGQCTVSFSGETVPAAFNHTLSWREYCKLILAEARLWVDDNSLTDYALPIAIIDDAGDLERTNQFYTELSNSKLYVDLWVHADNLTNLNASYVKCFNADMKDSPIPTAKFEGAGISQVRIKDATWGVRAFKNTAKTINSLELVDISGDWTEAFRNSVSTGVKIGKFTTNGLTSAKDMFRGCEIRYQWYLDEDKLKTFFNDTYNKWVAGEYDFRSAFVGSYHSGTIPEQFMSAEDQFACNWDPAILIQKVASTYDVSRQPLTCYYYAGDSAVNNGYSKYLAYSKTVHTIKLVSRQYDESYDAAYIYIDGKAVKSWGSRGHFVGVIDCKTMQFKYEGSGDTYGTPDSADAVWAAAINAAGSNDIIVSVTYDATSVTSSARNSINSCGGSGSTWTSARIAHTFIGKKGLSSGNGYEGTASGSSYSTISAQFDEDRGLVYKSNWGLSQKFGLSPIYEKGGGQDEHFDKHPNIIVPEEDFWKWYSVFAQIKSDYDCALFSITENNKANFNVDVLTSGDERQINYNYDTSFRKAVEANVFDNLILHLRKVENVTNKNISIEGMFKNTENLHCVGEIKNIQDITSAFEECRNIIEVRANLNNVEIADYAFKNCHSLTNVHIISNSCYTAMHMFENCDSITDFNIKEMTALIDATSMFEGCTAIKTEYFTKATEIPETLQVTRRMFAKCNITEISGNWVPPNSYTSYRNQDENGIGNLEDDWVNETTKEGWSFPRDLYDADQMFTENPITKISNLKFNPNANNSWIFSSCSNLTTIKYSFLDIDTFTSEKHTGMFDRCSLKKENVIWLPISISSDFNLAQLGFFTNGSAGNEKITYWIVDDHWCEVDHSGFVEYQHIRRPAYLDVYRKNYDKDVIIKFWSHPHIHSAEMRGYNELHDTKVYYDPETLQGGATINYNEWLKGKQTK